MEGSSERMSATVTGLGDFVVTLTRYYGQPSSKISEPDLSDIELVHKDAALGWLHESE
jgi:hypothetical protein